MALHAVRARDRSESACTRGISIRNRSPLSGSIACEELPSKRVRVCRMINRELMAGFARFRAFGQYVRGVRKTCERSSVGGWQRSLPVNPESSVIRIAIGCVTQQAAPGGNRAAQLIHAQVALGGFEQRCVLRVNNQIAVRIPQFHHADRIKRTVTGTLGATDAGLFVNDNQSMGSITVNRGRRAFDHANRVEAVQTRVRDHVPAGRRSMPDKPRIAVVRGCAGPYAIVAARAAIQVDDHRGRALHIVAIHQKIQEVFIDSGQGIRLEIVIARS